MSTTESDNNDCMCRILREINGKDAEFFIQEVEPSLPIDIDSILENHGITVKSTSFDKLQKELFANDTNIIAMVFAFSESLFFFYAQGISLADKRFALAHELGHCCQHMKADSLCHIELQTDIDILGDTKNNYIQFDKKKELEADRFARELLIPKSFLSRIIIQNKDISLEDLSINFGVPKSQMKARLSEFL